MDIIGRNDRLRNVVDYDGITSIYEKFIAQLNDDLAFRFVLIYALQMTIIVLGALSAALVALQTESNRKWTKPLAILVTLLLTISASIQNSFQLKTNSDALIRLSGQVLEEAADIGLEMQKPSTPDEVRESLSKRVKRYNQFYGERLKIRGNVEGRAS